MRLLALLIQQLLPPPAHAAAASAGPPQPQSPEPGSLMQARGPSCLCFTSAGSMMYVAHANPQSS